MIFSCSILNKGFVRLKDFRLNKTIALGFIPQDMKIMKIIENGLKLRMKRKKENKCISRASVCKLKNFMEKL